MTATDTHRAIEAVWRMESARIIAKLARMLRDVGLAEEIAQDAWVAALEQWTAMGLPENPGAWLMATAKNRAIDQLRRGQLAERKSAVMMHDLTCWAAVTSVRRRPIRLPTIYCGSCSSRVTLCCPRRRA